MFLAQILGELLVFEPEPPRRTDIIQLDNNNLKVDNEQLSLFEFQLCTWQSDHNVSSTGSSLAVFMFLIHVYWFYMVSPPVSVF